MAFWISYCTVVLHAVAFVSRAWDDPGSYHLPVTRSNRILILCIAGLHGLCLAHLQGRLGSIRTPPPFFVARPV